MHDNGWAELHRTRAAFAVLLVAAALDHDMTDAATEVEGDGGTDAARRVRRAVREVVLRTQRWAG